MWLSKHCWVIGMSHLSLNIRVFHISFIVLHATWDMLDEEKQYCMLFCDPVQAIKGTQNTIWCLFHSDVHKLKRVHEYFVNKHYHTQSGMFKCITGYYSHIGWSHKLLVESEAASWWKCHHYCLYSPLYPTHVIGFSFFLTCMIGKKLMMADWWVGIEYHSLYMSIPKQQ